MNRDDILKEFGITDIAQVTTPAEDMADEIVHLRRQLRKYERVDAPQVGNTAASRQDPQE